MKKGKRIRGLEGRRIFSVILAIILIMSPLGLEGMAEEVEQEETPSVQQEETPSVQQEEAESNQTDTASEAEVSGVEESAAPAEEDADSAESAPDIQTRTINTTEDDIISADVTFWTGTSSFTDHSVNELLFNIEVNNIGAAIPYYSLTPSFTSAAIDSITVYSYDSNGSLAEVDASLYSYDPSTGTVIFDNLNEHYLVQYTTNLTSSFKDADMAESTGPEVDASFTANYGNSAIDYQTASDSIKVRPIDAGNYNNDTIATDVTIAEDAETSTGSSVTATILWRLYSLLEDDGVTESDITDYAAGSYFVFKLNTELMEFYNNTSGYLTRIETNEQVGSYYTTDDGYVVILLDASADTVDFVDGSIALTSHIDGYDSERFEYDFLATNDMVYDDPEEASFGISKSGLFVGENGLEWSIIVNAEQSTLNNLTITDSDSKNNGNVSSDYKWEIRGDGTNLNTGALKVYEYDPETGTRVTEVSIGTADGEYSVVYTPGDSSDNGSVEIIIHGETQKTYEIVLQGIDDEESTTSGEKRTYQNTVTATADDEPSASAEASVTKDFPGISKTLQSITTTGSTGIVTWEISYNTNGTSVATGDVVLTDKLGPAQYLTSNGEDSGENLAISQAVIDNIMNITYTKADGEVINLDSSDYSISIVDNDSANPNETYTIIITLNANGTNALGDSINGSLSISYQSEVDLDSQSMPAESAGWTIANEVSMKNDVSSGPVTGTFQGIVKNYVSVDYNNELVNWRSTVNSNLTNNDTLYDVLLSDGLTIIEDSITIKDATGNNIDVYRTDETIDPSKTEYFVVDYSAKNDTTAPTDIEYTAGGGFKLTYVNTTTGGVSSGGFVIDYKTSFEFNSSNYITKTNRMYLVSNGKYIFDDASVTLGGSSYNRNGLKNSSYTTLVSDGVINGGRITWTSYINAQNNDISGWTFTDPLLLGKESSTGSEVSNSGQAIENVYIYAYTVQQVGSWAIGSTDLTSEIWSHNGTISTDNNEVKVTFPSGSDMTSFMADNGLTTMRFAIRIVTTLDNEIAPYYPNTSYLKDGDTEKISWSASITPAQYQQTASKVGTISNGVIDYSVTLNKSLYLIEDMVITDSLMYDNDGNQLLYLKYDEGDTKNGIRIYKAKVTAGTNLTYEADYSQEITDFTVAYVPGDSSNKGFTITMGNDVNYALVVEYSCYVNQNLVNANQTLNNTVEVSGSATEEADWSEAYKYNTSSGSYRGIQVDVSLQKVDEDENPLAGATFALYDSTRSYIAREGTVDENGLLTLNEILTGVYYLVETPPEGYGTDYSGLGNAIRLAITYDAATGEVTMTLGSETNPIMTVTGNMGDTPAAILNIPNEKMTGSFSVTKFANDENGE